MNNLSLAYLGDAVFELYIREYLINKKIYKVNDLQKESLNYITAPSQRKITEEEIEIVKRGRNASSHKSKTTDVVTYHMSTGFECLIGYLYLNNKERLKEIMEKIL